MNELGPEARGILDAGRDGDAPTAADRARLRAAVFGAVAAGSVTVVGGASTAAAATVGTGGALGVGWKALLAVVALGAVGTVTVVQRESAHRAASVAPVVQASAQPPLPQPAAPAVASEAPPASTAEAATHREDPPKAPPPRAQPTAQAAARPVTSAVEADPSPPDTLSAETRRLRDAHAALKSGDGDRALALLDEHGSAGPQLREERAAGRVFALCELGRVDDARAAASRFLAESPRSPLADRVRASCGGR